MKNPNTGWAWPFALTVSVASLIPSVTTKAQLHIRLTKFIDSVCLLWKQICLSFKAKYFPSNCITVINWQQSAQIVFMCCCPGLWGTREDAANLPKTVKRSQTWLHFCMFGHMTLSFIGREQSGTDRSFYQHLLLTDSSIALLMIITLKSIRQ